MKKQKGKGYKIYLDNTQAVEKRVKDLLSRMTLEEKISQLGANLLESLLGKDHFSIRKVRKIAADLGIGVLHNIVKDFRLNIDVVDSVQHYLKEKTRLGIPAIITGEGVHGHMSEGATIFPHGLALASTWNPELVRKVSSVVAREARSVGVSQILSPVLDLSREPRWGRCQENYGEDP
ncbi:MAG: beta-glucosidase, partial [bacterium (Candidatus Ratteibacteria) CG23_combo_of_CG06-09_8_20_14_all_48_7]